MKKRVRAKTPVEEFYIVAARDCTLDLDELKESCGWYADSDDALAEAALEAAYDEDKESFPQVVYRVQKFVEVK